MNTCKIEDSNLYEIGGGPCREEIPLITFLRLLGVKHTKSISNKCYDEHPHKYDLYGGAKTLSDYGLENVTIRITDKQSDIFNIKTPFFTDVAGDFVIVRNVQQEKVEYISNGLKISLPPNKLCHICSGIILLAENNTKSM